MVDFEKINKILFETNKEPGELQEKCKLLKEDILRIEAAVYEIEKTRHSSATYDNLLSLKAELDSTEKEAKGLDLEIKRESERLLSAEYNLNEALQKIAFLSLQDKQTNFYLSNLKKALDELRELKLTVINDFCKTFSKEVLLQFKKLLPDVILFNNFSCTFGNELLCFEFKFDGLVINPDTFSAGQKQILAVSFLASFLKTSKRNLPIIIDTPLAQLDTNNTKTFCTSFLSEFTNQALILATDKESAQIKEYIPQITQFNL